MKLIGSRTFHITVKNCVNGEAYNAVIWVGKGRRLELIDSSRTNFNERTLRPQARINSLPSKVFPHTVLWRTSSAVGLIVVRMGLLGQELPFQTQNTIKSTQSN